MKSLFVPLAAVALAGVLIAVPAGCAPSLVDLVERGAVRVELLPGRNVRVPEIHVYEDGGELLISGRVRRRQSTRAGGGYVDIVVAGPDGRVMDGVRTRYYPRIIPRDGKHESSFAVRFPFVPPEGSTIKIGQRD